MPWPPDYCSSCGARLATDSIAASAASCTACGSIQYRNAKPCAGVLVERGGRLLLARRGIEPQLGAWDVVGGFVQPHEHPRQAAIREALEETGLRVELRELVGMYVDRYGDGPGADYTLNIYFRAVAHVGEPKASSDVSELCWFAASDLPDRLAFRHEHDVLAAWRLLRRLA